MVYPSIAYAIGYETLIAFTYYVVRHFWQQDRQMRSGKKEWKNIKRKEE